MEYLKPFVSFIIPAFNAQKTIAKCLDSILRQDYPSENFEVIVVDNNSSDQTVQLVLNYKSVKLIFETKQGRSQARNTGAKEARGEYLAFIDSDVFLHQSWLTNLMKGFQSPSSGGAQGRIIPCNYDGQEALNSFRIRQQNEATKGSNIILDLMFSESPMINSAACLYEKNAFLFVGGFDIYLPRHEDIDLAKRISLAGYDLFSISSAIAEVEYHSSGWISYFLRSFEEGFTKEHYLQKWASVNQEIKKIYAEPVSDSRSANQKSFVGQNFKILYYQVRDEIFINFIKSVIMLDRFYFLKTINALFRSFGRISGKFLNQYSGDFKLKLNQNLLKRVIKINGLKIDLEKELRFVYKDQKVLYILNVRTNDFLNLSSAQSLKEILSHKSFE